MNADACKPVPRRPLRVANNPRLAADLPIVGLGCSSFSLFFSKDENLACASGDWTPETIDQSHELVQEWIRTVHCAILEYGITLLDTAPWYGHGTSEVVIGWALDQAADDPLLDFSRSKLVINTKVGRYEAEPRKQFDFSRQATLASVERSLKRMRCDYIDVLQLHDPEFAPTLDVLLDDTIPAMVECRDKGLCRALGMTGYPLEVQHQILRASLDRFGPAVWDQSLTYSHYNLHDTSLTSLPISNTGIHCRSFADYCFDQSIALLAAAPLSMGLLTHSGTPQWHPASPELQQACRNAAIICEQHGVNISTLALVVALSHPRIPCTLLGMKDTAEVEVAAGVALRFEKLVSVELDKAAILDQVLTEDEAKVMQLLADTINGPFAEVWKNGSYKWDGVQAALQFWEGIDDMDVTEWQNR